MSAAPSERVDVEVGGRHLSLSNLAKVMYPATGFTKAEVIDYYTRVAAVMVPHLDQRPVTLVRYPNGVEGQSFFEKNCPSHRPDWVRTATMGGGSRRGQSVSFCLLESVAHLAWTANLAAIELHPSLAAAPDLDRPLCVVFDLDPGPGADVLTCAEVALWLRDVLEHFGLKVWPKTSGSKGLQLYVPINRPVAFDDTKAFALAVGQALEREHPKLITTNMNPAVRPGRVFIDWSQNVASKTTVAVYSLRARPRPTVSTPVTWDELSDAHERGDASALSFEAGAVLQRISAYGDLFEPLLRVEQQLPGAD